MPGVDLPASAAMDEPWDALEAVNDDDDGGGNATPSQMVSMLQMHKCPAIATAARKWTYSCLAGEICCDSGCCVKEYRKITQFWYGWFMLTIIGAFLLACLHYYKKQRLRDMRAQQIAFRRRNQRLQQEHIFNERVSRTAAARIAQLDDIAPPTVAVDPHASPHGSYLAFLRQYNHAHTQLLPPMQAAPTQRPPTNPSTVATNGSGDLDQREAIMDRYLAARAQQAERALAPPPSYEDLMRDKRAEEEPPPVYVEACKLIGADNSIVATCAHRDDDDSDGSLSVL